MPRHELKIWPTFFDAVQDGRKTFEARLDDRGYQAGDTLILQEYQPSIDDDPGGYTGRALEREVTYILRGPGFGIKEGYVVMAIAALKALEGGEG
jgi:hypothetical protein